MLGYVTGAGRGEANRLIAAAAQRLAARGWRLGGAWQVDIERPDRAPQMTLHPISGRSIRISQELGPHARGCRLDPGALEQAVVQTEAQLAANPPPRLLIVNKFGKQEVEGRGFRNAIGMALAQDVPVLTSVGQTDCAAFEAFLDGMGEALPPDLDAILAWAELTAPDDPA